MVEKRNPRNIGFDMRKLTKKSKYTASDTEILSDLDQLEYYSKTNLHNNKINQVVNNCVRQKRNRNSNISQSINVFQEEDAIEVLTTLMVSKNPKNKKKKSDTEQVCNKKCSDLRPHLKSNPIPPEFISNSGNGPAILVSQPIPEIIFPSSKANTHVKIARITYKLKISS